MNVSASSECNRLIASIDLTFTFSEPSLRGVKMAAST